MYQINNLKFIYPGVLFIIMVESYHYTLRVDKEEKYGY